MKILKVQVPEDWKENVTACRAWLNSPKEIRKRTSMFKNLIQALDENFIGWEINNNKQMKTFKLSGTKREILSALYRLKLYQEAGLELTGKDPDGRLKFEGTEEQWEKANKLTQING